MYVGTWMILIFVISRSTWADKTVGFPELLTKEHTGEAVKAESVPQWLNGVFLYHHCGAFGPPKGSERRTINHMFDCLGMMSSFEFSRGTVRYSNRYIGTEGVYSWTPTSNSRAQSEAKVGWKTLFTEIDGEAYAEMASKRTMQGDDSTPFGGIWKADKGLCKFTAYGDSPGSYRLTVRNGLPESEFLFRDAATEDPKERRLHQSSRQYSSENEHFRTTLVAYDRSGGRFDIYRTIDKIEQGKEKPTTINMKLLGTSVDLSKCREVFKGVWNYGPDPSYTDVGYVSELVVTDKYLILIENPYVLNPCYLLDEASRSPRPFFRDWFRWKTEKTSTKFHIVSKANGHLLRTVSVSPVFISRVINAVENSDELGYLVIDALVHPSSNVLNNYYSLEFLMSKSWPPDAVVKRYSLKPDTGAFAENNLLPQTLSAATMVINEAMYGDTTASYAYFINKPYSDGSSVYKINLMSSTEQEKQWRPSAGVYPGEPTYVTRMANSTVEDDGVLLIPAFDSNDKKGLLYIVRAADMTQIGKVESPMLSFGSYSRFYPVCDAAGSIQSMMMIVLVVGISALTLSRLSML